MRTPLRHLLTGAVIAATLSTANAARGDEPLTVYVAKKIVTMDPTRPNATAVAVRGKRIVSVGSLDDLKPWLDAHPHTIDKRFADKVLMPGLIDAHMHPMLGALQFGTVWITPESWQLHDESVPATRTPPEYWQRLKAAVASAEHDGKALFITWGWSAPEHGPMTREMLDALGSSKPIMVWQRSVHEAVFNTRALEWMKLTEADVAGRDNIDWVAGHFIEGGLFEVAVPTLGAHFFSPAFVDSGDARNTDYIISGGITTVGDLSTGGVNWELEMATNKRNLIDKQVPFRTVLIPAINQMGAQKGGLDPTYNFRRFRLSSGWIGGLQGRDRALRGESRSHCGSVRGCGSRRPCA